MKKKLSFAMPLILVALMTVACSSTEANKEAQPNQATPPAQAQSTDANNPNVVKAEGAVAVIPTTPQPGQPAAPATAPPPAPPAPVDPNAPAPKLFIASKKVDLGTVKPDTTLNRTITLKNTGKAELKIEAVTPSCGCTAVDFPKTIAVGKSGIVKYKVDTGKGTGPRTKTITIKSNDPNEPTLTYEFSFTLK